MFLVHEEMLSHPKWEKIEAKGARAWADALAVWSAAGLDCKLRQVDGTVSRARLEKITPLGKKAAATAALLVEVGLWEATAEGFVFHDWDRVQETREEIQRRRARWNSQKASKRKPPTFHGGSHSGIPPGSDGGSHEETKGNPRGIHADSRAPNPTPNPNSEKSESARASGSGRENPKIPLHVQIWRAWGDIAHGGLPAGSPPPSVHDCVLVLEGRGVGVDRFREVAASWFAKKREAGKGTNFNFLAQDLAGLLDAEAPPSAPASNVVVAPPEWRERYREAT